MVARWAVEVLQTMNELREDSHTIRFPFFVLQGSEDSFVSPAGAEWMYRRSQSADKKWTCLTLSHTTTYSTGQLLCTPSPVAFVLTIPPSCARVLGCVAMGCCAVDRLRVYRGAFHDLLHDLNREQVFDDILRWLNDRVDKDK